MLRALLLNLKPHQGVDTLGKFVERPHILSPLCIVPDFQERSHVGSAQPLLVVAECPDRDSAGGGERLLAQLGPFPKVTDCNMALHLLHSSTPCGICA